MIDYHKLFRQHYLSHEEIDYQKQFIQIGRTSQQARCLEKSLCLESIFGKVLNEGLLLILLFSFASIDLLYILLICHLIQIFGISLRILSHEFFIKFTCTSLFFIQVSNGKVFYSVKSKKPIYHILNRLNNNSITSDTSDSKWLESISLFPSPSASPSSIPFDKVLLLLMHE